MNYVASSICDEWVRGVFALAPICPGACETRYLLVELKTVDRPLTQPRISWVLPRWQGVAWVS
jgi:hypothetical protein